MEIKVITKEPISPPIEKIVCEFSTEEFQALAAILGKVGCANSTISKIVNTIYYECHRTFGYFSCTDNLFFHKLENKTIDSYK